MSKTYYSSTRKTESEIKAEIAYVINEINTLHNPITRLRMLEEGMGSAEIAAELQIAEEYWYRRLDGLTDELRRA